MSAISLPKKIKDFIRRQKQSILRLRDTLRRKEDELETVREVLSLDAVTCDPDVRTVVRLMTAKCVGEIRAYLSEGTLPDWMVRERQSVAANN